MFRTVACSMKRTHMLADFAISKTSHSRRTSSNVFADVFRISKAFLSSSPESMKHENERLINLANMKEFLESNSQTLLTDSIPESMLHDHVILRILPNTHPFIPYIKGKNSFYVISKALKLIIGNFVINRNVKFHLTSVHVEDPCLDAELSDIFDDDSLLRDLENKLIEKVPLFDPRKSLSSLINDDNLKDGQFESSKDEPKIFPSHFLFPWTYKIIIRWKTCSLDCQHLNLGQNESINKDYPVHNNQTNIECNSNKDQEFDLININESIREIFGKLLPNKQQEANSSPVMNNDRVISGLFIFELSLKNDKILVLTVDDVEIIDKKSEEKENFNNLVTA